MTKFRLSHFVITQNEIKVGNSKFSVLSVRFWKIYSITPGDHAVNFCK